MESEFKIDYLIKARLIFLAFCNFGFTPSGESAQGCCGCVPRKGAGALGWLGRLLVRSLVPRVGRIIYTVWVWLHIADLAMGNLVCITVLGSFQPQVYLPFPAPVFRNSPKSLPSNCSVSSSST